MRLLKTEFERLKSVKSIVKSNFSHFGINKKQEITRLLYEISKREHILPSKIIKKTMHQDYNRLKKYLLQRRYPFASLNSRDSKPYLPKIELKVPERLNLKKRKFSPQNIFIEASASASFLASRFRDLFPKAHFQEIKSLKDYECSQKRIHIRDYNKRKDTIFIVNESHDFFKKCPCTKNALGCGYRIFNLGFGCIFDCDYCYLQDYTNSPGIILPANLVQFFDKFNFYKKTGMRVGTGEFCDSLALDYITEYSIPIVEFFRQQKGITFEFKTKSANIENLLRVNHQGKIVVSWSLNPQCLIDENEFFTASLNERLNAALKCQAAGYKLGFHFDPVIYYKGWENEYKLLIENLFNQVSPEHIAWISVGTFRFSPPLKPIIEKRFPQNRILDEELLLGFDNKLRYPFALRYNIYKKMIEMLRKRCHKLKLYLCMEDVLMWKELHLKMPSFFE